MKRILVRADDLGYCEAVNYGGGQLQVPPPQGGNGAEAGAYGGKPAAHRRQGFRAGAAAGAPEGPVGEG